VERRGNHNMNGSSRAVLTATSHSYENG